MSNIDIRRSIDAVALKGTGFLGIPYERLVLATNMLITDLKPQLALITGATGGIGLAPCLALPLLASPGHID